MHRYYDVSVVVALIFLLTHFGGAYLSPNALVVKIGVVLVLGLYVLLSVSSDRFWRRESWILWIPEWLMVFYIARAGINIGSGVSVSLVARNSVDLCILLLTTCIYVVVKDRARFHYFVRWLLLLNCSSAFFYFLNFFEFIDSGYNIKFDAESGVRRLESPFFYMNFLLGVVSGWLLTLRKLRILSGIALFCSIIVLFSSFFRVFILGTLFCLTLILLSDVVRRLPVRSVGRMVGVGVLFGLAFGQLGGLYIDRVLSVIEDVTSLSGTSLSRLAIWVVRYESVVGGGLWLGHGFVTEPVADITIEQQIADPTIPDFDNGWAALLVIGGLPLIGIYSVVIMSLVLARRRSHGAVELNFWALILILFLIPASFFRDFFINQYALVFFAVFLGIIFTCRGVERRYEY